jgi:hypothetical protein
VGVFDGTFAQKRGLKGEEMANKWPLLHQGWCRREKTLINYCLFWEIN